MCKNIHEADGSQLRRSLKKNIYDPYPILVCKQISEKRKLRRQWQTSRLPADYKKLNRATKDLKNTLECLKNQSFQEYLENLTATKNTDSVESNPKHESAANVHSPN